MATLTATEQRRLGPIRPELRADLVQLMAAAESQLGFTLAVPDDGGTRSSARQLALYNDSLQQGGGVLAYPVATPGKSRHEYGAAFDLHIVAGGANDDGTGADEDYLNLATLAESLAGSPGLTAGYFFAERGQGQQDLYHFQLDETLQASVDAWNAMPKGSSATTVGAIALAVVAAGILAR